MTITETSTNRPAVYVGTFAKYNAGSIGGAWLKLDNYTDKEEFLEACAKLHSDESDPEFMFQDFENFPEKYYSEDSISDELFEFLEMDENDRKIVELFWDHVDKTADAERALEAYRGCWDSEEDWAWEVLKISGIVTSIPEQYQCYFNVKAWMRDQFMNFVHTSRGVHVFDSNF